MKQSIAFSIFIFLLITTASSHNLSAHNYLQAEDSLSKLSSTISAKKILKGALLEWNLQPHGEVKQVNIQLSDDGNIFRTIHMAKPANNMFEDGWNPGRQVAYYRLEILWKNNTVTYTSEATAGRYLQNNSIILLTNPFTEQVRFKVSTDVSRNLSAEWRSAQGTLIETQNFTASAGSNIIQLTPPGSITPGTYYLRVMNDDKKMRQLFRVVKQ